MYLGGATYTSKILEHPEAMDLVEDPFVIVIENPSLPLITTKPWQYEDMASVMTLMHDKGWETVNITFEHNSRNNVNGRMVALFKNPRAKRKNQPEMEG